MRLPLSCLIFDFDGVIADTDKGRFLTLKDTFKKLNLTFPDDLNKKDLIGLTTKAFLLKHFKNLDEKIINNIVKIRHSLFLSNLEKYCIPYENMRESIAYFFNKFDLAIVTTSGKSIVQAQLDFLCLKKYFKWVISREICEDINYRKTYKPVGRIIKKKIDECLVIEDSDYGVKAAKEQGYYCIRFDPEQNFQKTQEDEKVESYYDIRKIIKMQHCL